MKWTFYNQKQITKTKNHIFLVKKGKIKNSKFIFSNRMFFRCKLKNNLNKMDIL